MKAATQEQQIATEQAKAAQRLKTQKRKDGVKRFFRKVGSGLVTLLSPLIIVVAVLGAVVALLGAVVALLAFFAVVALYAFVFVPLLQIISYATRPFGLDMYNRHLNWLSRISEPMNPSPRPDYYDVMGVPRDATLAQIKSKYYELSLLYHEDKWRGSK